MLINFTGELMLAKASIFWDGLNGVTGRPLKQDKDVFYSLQKLHFNLQPIVNLNKEP